MSSAFASSLHRNKEKNQWGYDGIRQEQRNSMDKPGFKVYIYASTEATQRETDRMKNILKEFNANDCKVAKDILIIV